jgi:hypothetical protein
MLRSRLCFGEQIRRSDAECDRKRGHGSDGWSALGALDTADVVAVDAALKPETLL